MRVVTFVNEPGWLGTFTRDQHPGALPNGTRVRKVNSEPGDTRPDGALGAVLGSVGADHLGIAYFVEWDSMPKAAVLTVAKKLEAVLLQ